MPLRKMKQKKYKGIYEYYRAKDIDKVTMAYYINYRNADNKPIKEKTDASTPEEAVIILKQKLNQRHTEPKVMMNSRLLLKDYAEQFFSGRQTINNDNDRQKFNKHIGDNLLSKKVQKVDEADLEQLQSDLLLKSKLAPKTINDIVALLSTVLNKAFNEKITSIPLRKIKKLDVDNNRTRVLTDKEVNYLLNEPKVPKIKMFLFLAYYTGQRPQSILNLKKRDIDMNSNLIYIAPIKKSKSHHIPIGDKLKKALFEWIEDLEFDDYLIHPNNNPQKSLERKSLYDQTKKFFKPLNENIGTNDRLDKATLYTLRHTALSNIYQKTGDIYLTQKIANHTDVRMTQRYAKLNDELKSNAMDML